MPSNPLEMALHRAPPGKALQPMSADPASRPYSLEWQYLPRRSDLETASFVRCDSADHV